MSESIAKEIYKKVDEERIKQALENENWNDAVILFKYSTLTKNEFNQVQQQYSCPDVFNKQMKEDLKEKDKERIEKAILEHQDDAAEYIFKTSELTNEEFNEIKRRLSLPTQSSIERTINQNTWEQILNVISTKISAPSYQTWFKNTKGEFVGENLKVFSANSFQKDWLEARYQNLIFSVLEQVLGKVYDIQFIAEDNNES